MAVTRRPIVADALEEKATRTAWKTVPSCGRRLDAPERPLVGRDVRVRRGLLTAGSAD